MRDSSESYIVHRRPWMAWAAEKYQPGEPARPIRFKHWSVNRSDNDIGDDASGVFELSHEIMRDAIAERGVQLGPLYGADPENQLRARAFFGSRLNGLRPGTQVVIDADDVRAWMAERE